MGLECAIFVAKGLLAKSNADLVEKIVYIGREFTIEPATADEAKVETGFRGA